ncbi:MAG TPA: hydrogenase maturation nickel metallochaperone HypA [Candidatus Binatia bacterium]|jgi:hydrogenase nickel incorporation protein HypA/HybF
MHESALAQKILDVVLARAGLEHARRVHVVRGWVAETESLAPQSLAFHFEARARGTIAEGARLELRLVHVEARCRPCGGTYAPEHHLLLCPTCGSTDADLLGPTGIAIESLDVADC